ncbi:MAG: toxin [Promicromonosporaceae bacterium]|nr:toxin [Promicromonosporaceae bacterium]
MTPGPRRVRVVGNSGAGKTTFALAVAQRLGVPHLELDEVFWDAGWEYRDPDEARARLAEFLAGPGAGGWAVDGNWNGRLAGMLDDADVVAWLDYPRRVVMARVVWRTVRRGATRQELWHGNRERLGNLLRRDPEQNIVRWSWTEHHNYRARYAALAAQDARIVRLTTPAAAARWLAALDRT